MILDVVIAVAGGVLLFIVVVVLRPMRSCPGRCSDCAIPCDLKDQEIR